MWIGVLDTGDDEVAVLVAYEADRLFSFGAPLAALPRLVQLVRQAGADAGLEPPRCGRCAARLEIPPLDAEEAPCAST